MSKRIKILTPRIYEHSDFFHNAYDFARENSLNTNELCLELSHYLVEHFDKVWKIEKPRIYKQITDLQSQLAEKNKEQNQKAKTLLERLKNDAWLFADDNETISVFTMCQLIDEKIAQLEE